MKTGLVIANVLNVRYSPGVSKDNPPIDMLSYRDKVTIYETRDVNGSDWYRIRDNAWVHGGWIRLTEDKQPSNLEVVERNRPRDIVELKMSGQLETFYNRNHDVYEYVVAKDSSNIVNISQILDKFLYKEIVVTIKLKDLQQDGIQIDS